MLQDEICQTLTTIGDYVRYAITEFNRAKLYYGHGTDNAFDEAMYLILHTLQLEDEFFDALLDTKLLYAERLQIYDILYRRVNERIPAAYLTQHMSFAGLDFYVDERVLVPRSPIAELILESFSPWIDPEQVTHVLDLCTGSGCIAIAMNHAFPQAHVDATDISPGALQVAEINRQQYNLNDKLSLIQSDLFENCPSTQYDIIVSNPPYVAEQELFDIPDEYTHEPELGLRAGNDGLDAVRVILAKARQYLKPNGILVTEVGNSKSMCQQQFPDIPFTWLEFEHGGDGVFLLRRDDLPETSE